MTTKSEIAEWLDRGLAKKATHMIVMTDTFEHDDYPVYATSDEDCVKQVRERNNVNMQRVTEVYDLRMDLKEQLNARRVYNIPNIPIRGS